ncbi:MAG: hypothetical protein K2N16_10010 [Muribaculaceae bacterium]|nr:hypothetical protein [Muribaculaceae bacterium]
MKKIFAILALAAAWALPAMAIGTDPIAKAAATYECPVVVGQGLTLQSVLFDPEALTLTYTCSVPDEMAGKFGEFKKNTAMFADSKAMELTTDPDRELLVQSLTDNGVSVVYVFNCGAESCTATITPAMLQ